MRNEEPTWEETRYEVEHNRIDDFLGLPWLAYLGGVFTGDTDVMGWAVGLWACAVLIWTPWIIFRVRLGRPTGDVPRATAVLGIGLLPWIPALLAFEPLSTRLGLTIAFPLLFLWGATCMAMAAFQWPRLRTRGHRTGILVAGGLVWALFALIAFVVTGFASPSLGFLGVALGLLVAGLSAVAGVRVLIAAGGKAAAQP